MVAAVISNAVHVLIPGTRVSSAQTPTPTAEPHPKPTPALAATPAL